MAVPGVADELQLAGFHVGQSANLITGGGDRVQQADFRHANLEGANLRGANLAGASFRHANLKQVDLTYA